MKTKVKTPFVRKHARREPARHPAPPANKKSTPATTVDRSDAAASGWSWELILITAILLLGFGAVVVLFFVALRP